MTSFVHPYVLVVDDDEALARMLRVLLESEQCNVRVAHDGREALSALGEFVPDVVLLDLQMPIMDGRAFYREFRSLGFNTPVMLLSAFNADKARVELGADDAMDKPCDPEIVLTRVQRLVQINNARQQAGLQPLS